ncbi:hypothetical protein CHLRE_16g678094v5 [Chlamydomonas reinhardtii]|uniref:Uncharacterized protein n=1 Tax=Chlamydomonas reinhardtii TaxID=3055 RepID=A0A2K3CU19_CHLRE|nr:uncharacterized protein CHLRE_16g678094v5 [Chlamydomonas reinhardtii]PNW71769.1 hypothetical protein CHLRE_16g678094v5 [Chlamydomonas reinhardtii]
MAGVRDAQYACVPARGECDADPQALRRPGGGGAAGGGGSYTPCSPAIDQGLTHLAEQLAAAGREALATAGAGSAAGAGAWAEARAGKGAPAGGAWPRLASLDLTDCAPARGTGLGTLGTPPLVRPELGARVAIGGDLGQSGAFGAARLPPFFITYSAPSASPDGASLARAQACGPSRARVPGSAFSRPTTGACRPAAGPSSASYIFLGPRHEALQRGATIGRTTGTDADGCSSRDGLGSSSSPGAGSSVAIGAGGGGGGTGGLRSLCLGGTAAGEAALRAVSGLTRLAGAAGPSGRG